MVTSSLPDIELPAAAPSSAEAVPDLRRPGHVPSDVARADRQAVWKKTFRSDVRRWIAAYSKVGERDIYLWQWCLHGIELTTLSCVPVELRPVLHDTKLLSVILCVLFDDVADCGERAGWLNSLLTACGERGVTDFAEGGTSEETATFEQEHRGVVLSLWQDYQQRVTQLPHFEDFEPVWRFDLSQFFNAMRYGHLANRYPALINPAEHDVYTPHNMLMVSFATLDLMASPLLPEEELGSLREAIWHAQAMGRIGNVLSTWRRELTDRDFTGGIFSLALRAGELSVKDLQSLPMSDLESRILQSGLEARLFESWEGHRQLFRQVAAKVPSVDMEQLLEGHDRFLEMHLQSAGQI